MNLIGPFKITIESKLLYDWELQGLKTKLQGLKIAQQGTYNVPTELMVNKDQNGIHLMPTGNKDLQREGS
jgi:uncharacterized Zn finger protein